MMCYPLSRIIFNYLLILLKSPNTITHKHQITTTYLLVNTYTTKKFHYIPNYCCIQPLTFSLGIDYCTFAPSFVDGLK